MEVVVDGKDVKIEIASDHFDSSQEPHFLFVFFPVEYKITVLGVSSAVTRTFRLYALY